MSKYILLCLIVLLTTETANAQFFRGRTRRAYQPQTYQPPAARYGPKTTTPLPPKGEWRDWDKDYELRMSPTWEEHKATSKKNGMPWADWQFIGGEPGWSKLRDPEGKDHIILHMFTWKNKTMNLRGIRDDWNNKSKPRITLDEWR